MRKKDWFLPLSLIFSFAIFFWFMFDGHILKPNISGGLSTGESTYGDLPFHLSTITQIAYRGKPVPDNPMFSETPLVYPYLINLLSGYMVRFGISLRNSIIVPGMLFSLTMVVSLYFFYRKVSRSSAVGYLGTVLFFLNGGLGFFYFLDEVVFKGKLKDFLNNPSPFSDYSHVFTHNIQWNNFTTRIIVPERSVLLGIPIGLLILYLLFLKNKDKFAMDWSLFLAADLTGILPFVHTHTFLVFLLVLPVMALREFSKREYKKWLKKWFIFGLIVAAISFPQVFYILGQSGVGKGFIRFHIGWMAEPGIFNILTFWFKNGGILLILAFISLFITKSVEKNLIISGFFVFLLVNLFLFQPYDWDNIKFLFWVSIFASLGAATVLVRLWRRKKFLLKILSVILFFLLTASFIPSFYRELKVSNQLFSSEEISLGQWVRENTDKDSLFLTAPIHNSFVNCLAGRRIFMGHPGYLWTQGVGYGERENLIKGAYAGDATALKKLSPSYIVIGYEERNILKANEKYFDKHFPLIKKTENYKIYEVVY